MAEGNFFPVINRFWFDGIFPWIEKKDGSQKKEQKGKMAEDLTNNKWAEVGDDAAQNAGGVPRQ